MNSPSVHDRPDGGPLRALAVAAALFLGPNVLGLAAGHFHRVVDLSVELFYSARIELLPIPVAALVIVVVAYLVLARKRRRRRREQWAHGHSRSSHRRLLPPLEIVLLEIGNLTFLAFAFILAVLTAGLFFFALRQVVTYPRLQAASLTVNLGVALAVMLPALRPKRLEAQSWRRLSRGWIRWPGLLAIAIAGFGLVARWPLPGLLQADPAVSSVGPRVLSALYLGCIVGLGLCLVLIRLGQARAEDRSSNHPRAWFVPALGLAWLVNLGTLALFLEGVFLTLHSHVARG